MIDLTVNEEVRKKNIERCRAKGIILPTTKQMVNPDLVPEKVKEKLKDTGLWDVDPANLFRITWRNEPKEKGGLFGDVNYMEIPKELTGVKARIFALVGKYFPTGAHKVGATYGCLAPALVTGSIPQDRKPYGLQQETTAAAARTTPYFSDVNQLPFFRKR